MRRDVHRERSADLAEFLDRERRGHVAQAATAVFLRRDHPHQSDLSGLGENLARQLLVVVPLIGKGRDFGAIEFFTRRETRVIRRRADVQESS